jgi:hypothetical protein
MWPVHASATRRTDGAGGSVQLTEGPDGVKVILTSAEVDQLGQELDDVYDVTSKGDLWDMFTLLPQLRAEIGGW